VSCRPVPPTAAKPLVRLRLRSIEYESDPGSASRQLRLIWLLDTAVATSAKGALSAAAVGWPVTRASKKIDNPDIRLAPMQNLREAATECKAHAKGCVSR